MKTATNQQTGERLYQGADGKWRPLVTASNPDTGEQIYRDEHGTWQPMKAPDTRPQVGTARGIAEQAGQGMFAGFTDEMQGAAGVAMDWLGERLGGPSIPGTAGERYRQYRDAAREAQARFAEENPITSGAARFGGATALGMPLGMAAAGTRMGTALASRYGALPFLQRAAVAAPVGAGTAAAGGAVAGAGEAPELQDIPGEAARGAAVAAPFGLLAGPIGEGIATGVPAAFRGLRRAFAREPAAQNRVRGALLESGIETEQQARQALTEAGPRATLADIGEGTQAELEWLAQRPGQTRQAVTDVLEPRSRAQASDVMAELGGPGRRIETLSELERFRSEKASPLYERAYAQGVRQTEELDEIFALLNDAIPGAWNDAKRRGVLNAAAEGRALPDLGDAVPSLRGYQAIKMYLDGLEATARKAGDKSAANDYAKIRRRLLRELDRQNPSYKEARRQWAGSQAFENAMDEGGKILRPGQSAPMVRDYFSQLDPSEREGFRVGAAQAIEDVLDRMGYTHDATKALRKPAVEKKLRAMFETDAGYDRFMQRIEQMARQQRTFAQATGGSRTGRLAAREGEQLQQEIIDAMQSLGQGQGLLGTAANAAFRQARRIPTPGRRAGVRDLEGAALLNPDPIAQAAYLRQIYNPPPLIAAQSPPLSPLPLGLIAPGLLPGDE